MERDKMRSAIISVSIILSALPFTHLMDLGYSFLSFEVWATSFLFLCTGALLAALCARLDVLFVPATLAVYAFVSVYFVNTSDFTPLFMISVLLLVAVVLRRTNYAALPVMATFAIIFSLSNVFVYKETEQSQLANVPAAQDGGPQNALLHIILDEQSHLALDTDSTYSSSVAAGILRDYQDRGFHVQPQVRSVHRHTYKSLTNLVSLNGDMNNYSTKERGDTHVMSVTENTVFTRLRDEGYRVRAYQSDYLDFCADIQGIACSTYATRDMSVFEASGLSYGDRAHTALLAISRDYMNHEGGRFIGAYRAAAHSIAPPKKSYRYLSWAGKSMETIEHLRKDLETLSPGDVYFAHLLVPHFPFIYQPDCQIKSPGEWAYPITQGLQQSYASVERAYWDQTACTHKKIMQVLDVVADKPYLTVMIHGDHGARLFRKTDRESDADTLDTFFAIRTLDDTPAAAPSDPLLQNAFTDAFHSFIARDQRISLSLK